MNKNVYSICCRETGDVIESKLTLEEAVETIKKWNEEDSKEEDFVKNFWQITRYDVIKETVYTQTSLAITEKMAARLLQEELDPDPETVESFCTEAEAFEYESQLQPEIEFDRHAYPRGRRLSVTTYTVLKVLLDEDGDQVDCVGLGSSNGVTTEDVMKIVNA